jgi:hypothetical protein
MERVGENKRIVDRVRYRRATDRQRARDRVKRYIYTLIEIAKTSGISCRQYV